jgi:hypothetical protein
MASTVATSLTIDTQGLDNVHDSAGSGESSPNHSPSNKGVRKVGSYPSLHTVEEHAADTQTDHIAVLGQLNASVALPRMDLGRTSVSFNTNSSQLNLKSLFRVSKYPGGSSPANISPAQAVNPIAQQLGRACYSLEVDVVERMLQAGVDFSSAVDADGNLAIHYAAIAVEADDHDNIFSSSSNSNKPSSSSGWLCCGKPVADEKQRQWQSQSKVAQVRWTLGGAGKHSLQPWAQAVAGNAAHLHCGTAQDSSCAGGSQHRRSTAQHNALSRCRHGHVRLMHIASGITITLHTHIQPHHPPPVILHSQPSLTPCPAPPPGPGHQSAGRRRRRHQRPQRQQPHPPHAGHPGRQHTRSSAPGPAALGGPQRHRLTRAQPPDRGCPGPEPPRPGT